MSKLLSFLDIIVRVIGTLVIAFFYAMVLTLVAITIGYIISFLTGLLLGAEANPIGNLSYWAMLWWGMLALFLAFCVGYTMNN